MSLAAGTRLGSYEVTAKIGEGGMGEVWRAHDTQLGRDVALKILPEAFASDPDRLARFQREAQVLASLNHPNIAQILGIETAEGTRALVLELVEGPTLADRIAHGAIPLEEALPIAKQIAEALEAAHEAGVIHRDLKPANIKVRADGTVKVLDFGLAKALDPTPTGDPSQSPTLTAAATQMGVIMGTAAYMSPEQARGKPVDKRTDIWAFGCVLYEMLTGQRAFQGEDVSLTLASVMKSDVKVTTLPDDLPASVRTVLRRCLEKDASQRIRDIGDVRLGMEGAFETTVQAAVATPQARGFRQTLPLAAGTLVLGALVTGLAVWSLSRPTAPPLTRFTVALPTGLDPGGAQMRVAISPDGRTLAYSDRGQLYRRDLAQLEWQPIPGTDNAVDPMFSPDGQWLAFEDDEGLKRVPVGGGPAVTIVEGTIRGASWGPDGTIVFAHPFTGLFQVPPQGGVPEPLTTLEEGEGAHLASGALPSGETLFTFRPAGAAPDHDQIAVVSLESGKRRTLLQSSHPRYVASGHIIFVRESAVWAVPFDVDALEVTGSPVPVLENVRAESSSYAQAVVATDGTLLYLPLASSARGVQRTLVWVDREGREESLADLPPDAYNSVDVSPEGSRLALDIGASDSDVWIYDLARGTLNPLTTDPARDETPLWTPDGRQVVFGSRQNGPRSLYRRNADGTGDAELLLSDDAGGSLVAVAWSPEGDALVVMRRLAPLNDLMLLSMEDATVTELSLGANFNETRAAVSTDGEWIAYESDRSGRLEVYVERFPDLGDRQPISTGGGQQPHWSTDGSELFYLGAPQADRLMAVPVTTRPRFRAGTPELVIEGQFYDQGGRAAYDVAPDGRLVMIKLGGDTSTNDAPPPQLHVVINWLEELKRLVPVD